MSEQKENTWLTRWKSRPFDWGIPIQFTFLGGVIGGLLCTIMIGEFALGALIFFVLAGILVGFVPAMCTGFLITMCKLERNRTGIVVSGILGVVSGGLFAVVALIMGFNMGVVDKWFHLILLFAIIGGVAACILSFFVLPKPNSLNHNG